MVGVKWLTPVAPGTGRKSSPEAFYGGKARSPSRTRGRRPILYTTFTPG